MKIEEIIKNALKEDAVNNDITSRLLVPKSFKVKAEVIAKENCIVCGVNIAKKLFLKITPKILFKIIKKDGDYAHKGDRIAVIFGNARAILAGERTALNFLTKLSGIATLTNEFIKRIKPAVVKVMDTRKTTPLLREIERYAVRCGGATNHRLGLFDQVLIKDNHLKTVNSEWSLVNSIINKAKRKQIKTEIEVKNLNEFKKAIEAKPNIIMLDNFDIVNIKKAIKLKRRLKTNILIEVSGGVNLDNVGQIARTGVDRISIGALTHSAKAIDFSLKVI